MRFAIEFHLRSWASRIEGWMGRLHQMFVYFNNNIGGHAVRNARSLGAMLTGEEFQSAPGRAVV